MNISGRATTALCLDIDTFKSLTSGIGVSRVLMLGVRVARALELENFLGGTTLAGHLVGKRALALEKMEMP